MFELLKNILNELSSIKITVEIQLLYSYIVFLVIAVSKERCKIINKKLVKNAINKAE